MLALFGKIFKKRINNTTILQLNENIVRNSSRTRYDITIKNREILINWLIDVVFSLGKCIFKDDVIDMTVNLFDRYLAHPNSIIKKGELQLVGIACLSISNKFWEHVNDIFTTNELVYLTDESCSVSELVRMERKILKTLDYNIWSYSTHFYLDQYKNYLDIHLSVETLKLTKYALLCYEMVDYNPSEIAAGIVYSINNVWSRKLSEISGSCQSIAEKISEILQLYRTEIVMKNEFTAIEEIKIK